MKKQIYRLGLFTALFHCRMSQCSRPLLQQRFRPVVFILLLSAAVFQPALLEAQFSFTASVSSKENMRPDGYDFRFNIGQFNESRSSLQLSLGGQVPQPTQIVFSDEFFRHEWSGLSLRAGLHFFPFGNAFLNPLSKKGRIATLKRRNAAAAHGCPNTLFGRIPIPRGIPGLSFGVGYHINQTTEALYDTEAESPFDQTTMTQSVVPEIGYTLGIDMLSVGLRLSPLQYNFTRHSADNASPLLGLPEQTQGFRKDLYWSFFAGVRL